MVLAPTPSYFRRRQQQLARQNAAPIRPRTPSTDSDSDDDASSAHVPAPANEPRRENDKTATELCGYAVLWWVALAFLKLFGIGGGVSRRLVNLQYITWVTAYNTTFLLGYLVLDLFFFPSPLSKSVYSPTSKLKVHPDPDVLKATRHMRGRELSGGSAPALLEAVNKNGLVLFLLVRILFNLAGEVYAHNLYAGECRNGPHQPLNADNVHVGPVRNARTLTIWARHLRNCLVVPTQAALAFLKMSTALCYTHLRI